MKKLQSILLATLIALPAMNGRAESLEKLIPDSAEILGRMKREDIINMDLVKDAKGIVILNVTGFSIGIGGSGGDGILMAKTTRAGVALLRSRQMEELWASMRVEQTTTS